MPAGTARSSPVSARVGPYRFTSRSASIAGVSLINAPVTVRSRGFTDCGQYFTDCLRSWRVVLVLSTREPVPAPRPKVGRVGLAQQGEPRGSPRSTEVDPGVHSLRVAGLGRARAETIPLDRSPGLSRGLA